MKIVALGASNSRTSINKQLAHFAANQVANAEVEVLDLNDFELPLFSIEREQALGQPELAKLFLQKLNQADGVIISFAEHNGTYTVAYKNIIDWCSRINQKVFEGKPMVLLSTSPGQAGGASVLSAAVNSIPFMGGIVKASMVFPSFYDNFDSQTLTVTNTDLEKQLIEAANQLKGQ